MSEFPPAVSTAPSTCLFKGQIAVPEFRLKMLIEHIAPRQPIVFEWLLIDLAQHKAQLSDYLSWRVVDLCAQFYQLPQPMILLQKAAENLYQFDILPYHCIEMARLTLAELSLQQNQQTQHLLRHGQLAAKARDNYVYYRYQPLQQALKLLLSVDMQSNEREAEANMPILDPQLFASVPQAQILERLPEDGKDWYAPDTEILNCQETKRLTDYQSYPLHLNYQNQRLQLHSPEQALAELLLHLPAKTAQSLIRQVLPANHAFSSQLPSLSGAQLTQLLAEAETKLSLYQGQLLSLMPKQPLLLCSEAQLAQVQLLAAPMRPSLVIVLDEQHRSPSLTLSEQAVCIHLPKQPLAHLLPMGWQFSQGQSLKTGQMQQTALVQSQLEDSFGGQHGCELLLSLPMPEALSAQIRQCLEQQAKACLLAQGESDEALAWQLLRLFWLPAQEIWQQWLQVPLPALSFEGIRARLHWLMLGYRQLQQRSKALPVQDHRALRQWLQQQLLALSKQQSLPAFDQPFLQFAVSQGLSLCDSELSKQEWQQWLMAHTQAPQSLDALISMSQALQPVLSKGKLPSKHPWLTSTMVELWLKEPQALTQLSTAACLKDLPLIQHWLALEQTLTQIQQQSPVFADALMQDMAAIEQGLTQQAFDVETSLVQLKLIQSLLAQLLTDLNQYGVTFPDGHRYQGLSDQAVYFVKAARQQHHRLGQAKHLWLVDTNALLGCSQLLRQVPRSELIIVPTVVHEEIDRKTIKGQKALKKARQTVLGMLETNPRGNIISREADLSYLPAGHGAKKNDNHILAIACELQGYRYTLVTEDTTLRASAAQLQLKVASLTEFKALISAGTKTEASAELSTETNEPQDTNKPQEQVA